MGPTGVRTRAGPCRRHHPAHRRPTGRRHSARDRLRPGAPPARACSTSPCSRANKIFLRAAVKPPPTTLSGASAATERSTPPPWRPRRPRRDRRILNRYAHGQLDDGSPIPFTQVNRLQSSAIPLSRIVRELRHGSLAAALAGVVESTCAVHGMMQCMLKGVCSQCLQWQIDPATGHRAQGGVRLFPGRTSPGHGRFRQRG